MTALSPTASEVLPGSDAQIVYGIAGATIVAGEVVFLNASGVYVKFDCNDSTLNTAVPGIALNGASTSQPITVQTAGSITIGATAAPTSGLVYVAGATAGQINPSADIASGWRVVILGVATSATAINMKVFNSGGIK